MANLIPHKTSIDVAPAVRESMVKLLNQHVADTADLNSQVKQAHWNVKGLQFIALHEFFDDLAERLEDHVDLLAERVTAYGGIALGSVRSAAAASRLPELPADLVDGRSFVEALVQRYAALAATTRAAIDTASNQGDADTADIFTEVSRSLDKDLWFLEAHVQA